MTDQAPDILWVDDQPIYLSDLKKEIEFQSDFNICGEANDGRETIEKCKKLQPDIVVMDINMPNLNGIEITRQVLSLHPGTKILLISKHSNGKDVKAMLNAGAVGYLLKKEAEDELIRALTKISKGDIYLSSGVTRQAIYNESESSLFENIPVLQTKLRRPPITKDFIPRERITKKLEDNIHKPLALVSAGAGYGKSVAVSQWLEKAKNPYGWISLDSEHNNLQSFLLYLYEVVNKHFPTALNDTYNAISASILPPYQQLSRILFNDLCEIEQDLVIVLDDYYKIRNEQVHTLINDWLILPPPHIHLVIITRRDPPLNLQRLRLNDRLIEIRMEELSFSKTETSELFDSISDTKIEGRIQSTIHEKTEGWVIALRLVSLLVKNQSNLDKLISTGEYVSGIDTISDYLVSEVIPMLPENVRKCLFVTSFLQRFCVALIDHILLDSAKESETALGGESFIDWLIKENMFIISLDTEGEWYRFHHLFQEILLMQSHAVLSQEEKAKIHLDASLWFEYNGLLEESMHHAMEAESIDRAVTIIKKYRLPLINEGKWNQLDKLFKNLTQEIIDEDIELLIIEAYLRFCYADHMGVGETVEKLQKRMDNSENSQDILGEYHFYLGYTTIYLKQDPKECLKFMRMALREIPESSSEPRALMELFYALFSQIAGDYETAKPWLEKLIDNSDYFAPVRKNRLALSMLLTSTAQGDLKKVQNFGERGVRIARASMQKDTLGSCLMIMGHYHFRLGRWKKASQFYEEVLSIKYHVHTRSVVDSYTGLILSNYFMNRIEQSKSLLKEFEHYTLGLGDHHTKFIWSMKTRYALLSGDIESIKEAVRNYDHDFLHLVFWLDVPQITYARALLFDGSSNSLVSVKSYLESLVSKAKSQNNRIHLLELYALQAVYFKKVDKQDEAYESILASLDIAVKEDIKGFYIELFEELKEVINLVSGDSKYYSYVSEIRNEFKSINLNSERVNSHQSNNESVILKLDSFTPKELEILSCVAAGLRNKEIADKLGNSEETIKRHIYNMFQKTNARNRLNLVSKVKEYGII